MKPTTPWEAKPHPGNSGCVVTSGSVSSVKPEVWPCVIWGHAQGFALGQSMALAKDKETGELIVTAVNNHQALIDCLKTIADFAVGNGDVCEIIARRARKALADARKG